MAEREGEIKCLRADTEADAASCAGLVGACEGQTCCAGRAEGRSIQLTAFCPRRSSVVTSVPRQKAVQYNTMQTNLIRAVISTPSESHPSEQPTFGLISLETPHVL